VRRPADVSVDANGLIVSSNGFCKLQRITFADIIISAHVRYSLIVELKHFSDKDFAMVVTDCTC